MGNACARTHTHARIDTPPRAAPRLRRSAPTSCYSLSPFDVTQLPGGICSRLASDCSVAESNTKVQKSCKKFGSKEKFSYLCRGFKNKSV